VGDKNLPEVIDQNDVMVVQQSPMEMAQSFLTAGGNLESLEKMMDLQERWEQNEAKKLFFSAMASTQKDMPSIFEGNRNQQTNSNYSAYKDIVKHAKPIYSSHGLSVSFYEGDTPRDGCFHVCADVYHEKGFSRTYNMNIPVDNAGIKGSVNKTPTHAFKSSLSYARGMLLCNIFNIATTSDLDDDGNCAGGQIKTVNKEQISTITDMINSISTADEVSFCSWAKIESVEEMPVSEYNRCISALKALKAEDTKK
jgi:hypothetical protein